MSDLEEMTAAIAAGIAAIGHARQKAQQASAGLAEATAALAEATAGSAIADLPGITDQARQEVDAATGRLGEISKELTAYLASLGRSLVPESPQVKAPESQTAPRGRAGVHTASSQSNQQANERAEALRNELPPPVQRNTGQKTHGRWFPTGSTGVAKPITSGTHEGDPNDPDDVTAADAQAYFVCEGV